MVIGLHCERHSVCAYGADARVANRGAMRLATQVFKHLGRAA